MTHPSAPSPGPGQGPGEGLKKNSFALRRRGAYERGRRVQYQRQFLKEGLEGKISAEKFKQALSLAQNPNSKLFLRNLQGLAYRLGQKGDPQTSVLLSQTVLRIASQLAQKDSGKKAYREIAAQAQTNLNAIAGEGDLGPRLEFLASRFVGEVTDPWMLLGFGVASTAFKLTRLATLPRLLAGPARVLSGTPLSPRILASAAGLGVESAAFVMTVKGGHHLSGKKQDFSPQALAHEFLSTGMMLGFLKAGGFLSTKGFNWVHGIDPYVLPAPRLPQWTRFNQAAFGQAGMLGGILLDHGAKVGLGWEQGKPAGMLLTDSLVTLLHFNVAGHLSNRLMGKKFQRWQQQLDLKAEQINREYRHHRLPWNLGPMAALAGVPGLRLPITYPLKEARAQNIQSTQEGDGGGRGPKNNVPNNVIPFPIPKRRSKPVPTTQAILRPGQLVQQVEALNKRVDIHLEKIRGDMRDIIEVWKTYIRHLERGRDRNPDLEYFPAGINASSRWLLASLEGNQDFIHLLESTLMRTKDIPPGPEGDIHGHLRSRRGELSSLLGQAKHLEGVLREISKDLVRENESGLNRSFEKLRRIYLKVFGGRNREELSEGVSKHPKALRIQGVEGLLLGLGVKEIFRTRPNALTPDTGRRGEVDLGGLSFNLRAADRSYAEAILNIMERASGPDEAWQALAYFQPDLLNPTPKLVLKLGGHPGSPMMTWAGLHVPTILAFHGGSLERAQKYLKLFEPYLSSEGRVATSLIAWWLSQAIHARGKPRDWLDQIPQELRREPHVDIVLTLLEKNTPEFVFEEALGMEGELAILSQALWGFIKRPYDPQWALEEALKSPPAIREDVLNLTGSLFGAFHGPGIFPIRELLLWGSMAAADRRTTFNAANTLFSWSLGTRNILNFVRYLQDGWE